MIRSFLLGAALLICVGLVRADEPLPVTVHVNGVDLAYIERGSGAPVILLHGGLGDYSSWPSQFDALSRSYRVISYSRRFSYPTRNPPPAPGYSVTTDVDDLLALIRKLGLRDVRLVGQSYGGFVALVFAVRHPDIVHSLALSEPPAHLLARDRADGATAYNSFITDVWDPAAESFKKSDTQQAMRIFMNGLAGEDRFDRLPPQVRDAAMRNAPSMRALALSADPFAGVTSEQLRKLRIPTLIITGAKTIALHKLVNEELAKLIPNAQQVTIPDAGHGSPRDNPGAYNQAVVDFLRK